MSAEILRKLRAQAAFIPRLGEFLVLPKSCIPWLRVNLRGCCGPPHIETLIKDPVSDPYPLIVCIKCSLHKDTADVAARASITPG